MLPEVRVNRDRMEAAANDPSLLATDLAEHLVAKGVVFRDAYDAVGKLVARAGELGVPLDQMPVQEMKQLSPLLEDDVSEIFDARASLAKRKAPGAPSPQNISDRVAYWQQQLS
jgi:argininosuccinate lyase